MAANFNDLDPHTSARAAFAAELRKYRLRGKLSQIQVARVLMCDQSLVSALEHCKRAPQLYQAERLDQFFGLTEKKVFVRLYERLEREARSPRWSIRWTEEIEPFASVLRTWTPVVIYGLFQVEAYVRALFASSPSAPPEADQVEEQIRIRMRRKSLLERNPLPIIWDLVDEGALHRPVGGPVVLVEQLRALLEISDHPGVTIQIVPMTADCASSLMGGFVLAEVSGRPDALLMESTAGGIVATDPLVIAEHQKYHDMVRAHAYPKMQSQQTIRDAIDKWTKRI
ncbi:helix-turn-helix transcriptional regulator [Spongiactinospora sp. TRM90649]|uniref:helix-turn-helix domain-containing protein n=1 Tax=Spongiactinospora sp. TRM90649 TaxID=3031114 RepID=UPI0023F8552D|nr:helix-turn-helix transcriptional regulator [Spongiactinospora sp. TRM90649]MDF5751248.1 helix-turn-helix transcriptional regulator [Spongiactinospora sp. TRM90649]